MNIKQPGLLIDAARGMAGDMFLAALLGLGVPEETLVGAMARAARRLGQVSIELERVPAGETTAVKLHIRLVPVQPQLPAGKVWGYLEEAIMAVGLNGPYANFARRTLSILVEAERQAHSGGQMLPAAGEPVPEAGTGESPRRFTITAIGAAHTPYRHQAPYQPSPEAGSGEDDFYIEVQPEYAAGLADLILFSHVFVVSYLDRSAGYSLSVTPPWQEGEPQTRGLFATRTPNRPNPIGISRVPIRRIEGNRLYLGQLDLFDGTPVLDIKPFIETLDGTASNDGWLAGSDHLEMHRRGTPHQHTAEGTVLHEAQDILIDVIGAAAGLQHLGVDPGAGGLSQPGACGWRVRHLFPRAAGRAHSGDPGHSGKVRRTLRRRAGGARVAHADRRVAAGGAGTGVLPARWGRRATSPGGHRSGGALHRAARRPAPGTVVIHNSSGLFQKSDFSKNTG